ncbi:MAG TPA: polysaccharide deacetylase family protein [Verrucomicrobiae bacterium]|nr:polysaccharide deacetylase family protein [Verrucomicrobiae bacterium]
MPPKAVLAAILGLLLLGGCASAKPSSVSYQCPPSCQSPQCFCASDNPPAGLKPSELPQLVMVSFDDAVTPEVFDLVRPALERRNPNGCPLPATFFVTTDETDYWLVQRLHAQGNEIAVHTMTHRTSEKTGGKKWRSEILGARDALSALSLIPKDEIAGFRAPYLRHNKESFRIVYEAGFVYDSSITEIVGALSRSPGAMIWPYTLDYGPAQRCFVGVCPDAGLKGLFEIPMHALRRGSEQIAMDPAGTKDEIAGTLKQNFMDHYEGNRAPFGVYLHGAWLKDPGHAAALEEFLEDALSRENVWFATMAQVVAFMRGPVPAAEAGKFFSCPAPEPEPETCDGRDNDGNGETDEGLVHECRYPEGRFRTCAPCPEAWPKPV